MLRNLLGRRERDQPWTSCSWSRPIAPGEWCSQAGPLTGCSRHWNRRRVCPQWWPRVSRLFWTLKKRKTKKKKRLDLLDLLDWFELWPSRGVKCERRTRPGREWCPTSRWTQIECSATRTDCPEWCSVGSTETRRCSRTRSLCTSPGGLVRRCRPIWTTDPLVLRPKLSSSLGVRRKQKYILSFVLELLIWFL